MDILLATLAVLGCIAMMAGVMLTPRLIRKSPRAQRLIERVTARLRTQSTIDRMLSWVEAERPDLERASAPDGTVTLLFSDIEGSTDLNRELGDERWLRLLSAHNALVRAQIREHGGYEVKAQGDGFMVAFPSARTAIRAACEIQRTIDEYRDGDGRRIRIRIGLHTGEAIRREGDFFGRSVILAARIADQAQGGEILASSLVKELTEPAGDVGFDPPRAAELKGLGDAYSLFPVRWREDSNVVDLGRAASRPA
jgi:class 3 adenylate cyclase